MKNNMKNLSVLFLFTIFNMISFRTSAQTENFKLSDLKSKTWCMQGLTDKTDEANYEDNKVTFTMKGSSKSKYTSTFEYYLSISIETVFDSTKVGKVLARKYIVIRALRDKKSNPLQPQPISVFEIVDLNSTKLVIRNIQQQNLLEYKAR